MIHFSKFIDLTFLHKILRKNTLTIFLGGKCIAVPNTDDVLEVFGFGYSAGYGSPSGSQKDSPERDIKPIVQIVTGKC